MVRMIHPFRCLPMLVNHCPSRCDAYRRQFHDDDNTMEDHHWSHVLAKIQPASTQMDESWLIVVPPYSSCASFMALEDRWLSSCARLYFVRIPGNETCCVMCIRDIYLFVCVCIFSEELIVVKRPCHFLLLHSPV